MEDSRLFIGWTTCRNYFVGRKKIYKGVSANIDFYSGFILHVESAIRAIYNLCHMISVGVPRIEELINAGKII